MADATENTLTFKLDARVNWRALVTLAGIVLVVLLLIIVVASAGCSGRPVISVNQPVAGATPGVRIVTPTEATRTRE